MLIVEGSLIGPWVDELRSSCERYLTGGLALTIDLKDVSFADRRGIELLRELGKRQAKLINRPLFLRSQLNGGTHDDR